MKAKIKVTGEIVEVITGNITGTHTKCKINSISPKYVWYKNNEIILIEDDINSNIDWEQRRFELVKAIIPGILSNELLITRLEKTIPKIQDEGNIDIIASLAIEYTDTVIKQLKK